jgi:hypothetical protein
MRRGTPGRSPTVDPVRAWAFLAAGVLALILVTGVVLAREEQPLPLSTYILFLLLAVLSAACLVLGEGIGTEARRHLEGFLLLGAAVLSGAWFFLFAASGGVERAVVGVPLGLCSTAVFTVAGLSFVLEPRAGADARRRFASVLKRRGRGGPRDERDPERSSEPPANAPGTGRV